MYIHSVGAKGILCRGLTEVGAVARYVGARLGRVQSEDGYSLEVEGDDGNDVVRECSTRLQCRVVTVGAKALGGLGQRR